MYFQLNKQVAVITLSPLSVEDTEVQMPPRKHAIIDKATFTRLYFDEGLSLRAIASKTNTNYRLVRDSFKAAGLSWRTKSQARAGRVWDEATKAKISEARSGQKDAPEVAAQKRKQLAIAGGRGWNKGLTAATDERVARQREASIEVMRTSEFREACSRRAADRIAQGGYWSRGFYDSGKGGRAYYMSGWELRRWKELDADPKVVGFQVQLCRIPYDWEGHRNYVPDVLIRYTDGSTVLEEVKSRALLERPHKGQAKLLAKMRAGEKHAAANGWSWRVFGYDALQVGEIIVFPANRGGQKTLY